jgi:molybdate transport system substrate-binding protein
VLREQAARGAPFDLLIVAHPKYLEGVRSRGTPTAVALGALALYGKDLPADEAGIESLSGRVAIANPKTAPYGESAAIYLAERRAPKLDVVPLDDVRQAKLAVDRGAADYAIVSRTQASEGPLPYLALGPATAVRITAVMMGSNRAEGVLAFLKSPRAATVMRDAGLVPIP